MVKRDRERDRDRGKERNRERDTEIFEECELERKNDVCKREKVIEEEKVREKSL